MCDINFQTGCPGFHQVLRRSPLSYKPCGASIEVIEVVVLVIATVVVEALAG